MLQFSKQKQQHADYGTRVMETETIQKNGASLKSQTSKGNLIKNVLTIAMLLCFCAFTNKAVAWTGAGTAANPWQIGDGKTNTASAVTAKLVSGTLTITGTGNMADFWDSTEGEAPWWVDNKHTTITKVIIENGVTNIGNRAFHDCSSLDTISIPSSVTIIGRQAFYNCTSKKFTAITILNTVNTIEGEAFLNCTSLKTVTIENGNNNLSFIRYLEGWYTYHYDWFKGCPIQTLHLGRNYTYETNRPFKGISTLATLTIGNTVTTIDSEEFRDCNLLKTVTFQDGTNTLTFSDGNRVNAFTGCPIETLYLGRKLSYSTGAGDVPFAEIKALKTVTFGNVSTIISVPAYLFQNCTNLTSVTLPASTAFTTIDVNAFHGCTALPAINIPNTVTTIGNAAFSGCENLQSISIPSSVTAIGEQVFTGCNLLKTVTFQDGTNTLTFSNSYRVNAFTGCPIETLYLGRKLSYSTGAGDVPFAEIKALKTVTFGNVSTIISVPAYLFQNCTNLTSVTLPASTAFTTIDVNAFYGCTALPAINIPNSVTSIGASAFNGCQTLPSVTIPSLVTTIGSRAFANCNLLKTVTFQDGTNTVTFDYNNYDAFSGSPIETLNINRPLTTYNNRSYQPFANKTTIKTATFGSTVSTIPAYLFYNCTGLTSVTNNATTPQSINANVFGGVDVGKIPLTVPAASLALYKAAAVWRDFFSINGQATAIETPEADKFAIFPNPAKDEIFIRSEEPIEKVEIHDIAGKKIINCQTTFGISQLSIINSIDVSHLPKGIYFAKIFVGNQSRDAACHVFTKKIIKE